MNNYTVYMHISPSGKIYIGITCKKPEYRWNNGKGYVNNDYFTKAIKKYGWDNFEHIIVAKGLIEEEAKWLEVELIREWNSTNRGYGYNIASGGDGGNGLIGEKHPMYGKRGKDNPNYGKHRSDETKKKMSKAHKGKCLSDETKRKISEANKGNTAWNKEKRFSEETKKKMSDAKKGKYAGKNNPNYGKGDKIRGKNNPRAKAVICITTNMVFDTAKEGVEYYGCDHSSIIKVCKNKKKSCGKLSDGTPLVWRYIEIIEL